MEEILSVLGTPEMIAALETNLEEKMMSFGRGLAGGEIYHDGEIEGFFTGHAHLNGVLRTHLKKLEGEYIQNKITAVKHYFREKQVKNIDWSVGQDCQPANMALYLERQGFQKLPEENTGMALDITTMQGEEEVVKDLEIREIENLEELKVLRQLEVQGFGSSKEMAQHYYEVYASVGFGRGTAWRHFSGWQQAKAVALTSLLFYAGLAGIYGVTTVPEARRRGIARAMVLHAIHEARQAGYRIAILSPTEMSEGIYRRLGFRAYTQIRHYTCSL
jgi:GNAT superfamily N-acetyltransferase